MKTRKQTFGIEIYDLMEELENDETKSAEEKEAKIRAVFDAARKDIAVICAKQDCKMEEMAVLDAESGGHQTASSTPAIPPSSGTVLNNALPSQSRSN